MPLILDLDNLCFDECRVEDVLPRARARDALSGAIYSETGRRVPGRVLQSYFRHTEQPGYDVKGNKLERKSAPARRRTEPDTDLHPGSARLEARVREMKSADAIAACERNGLTFKREAPNPGVLGMRAKNSLYAAIRRGVELKL